MNRTRHDRENGFTLIELMTVIMIIAVLIAVLIPNFLGARRPAEDRQAQTLLRTGLTAARVVTAERGDLSAADVTTLPAAEPTITFVGSASTGQARDKGVSVGTGTMAGSAYVILASLSTSGRCFAVLDQSDAAPAFQRVETAGCTAAQFDPAVGWAAQWP